MCLFVCVFGLSVKLFIGQILRLLVQEVKKVKKVMWPVTHDMWHEACALPAKFAESVD